MKKILSVLLVALMLATVAVIPVSAQGDEIYLSCLNAYSSHIQFVDEENSYIECEVLGEVDGCYVFRAYVEHTDMGRPCVCSEQVIGDYKFMYGYVVGPDDNPTGLFVLTPQKEVVAAKAAYEQGIITDLAALAKVAGAQDYYENKICDLLSLDKNSEDYHYFERYHIFNNVSTADEKELQCMLVIAGNRKSEGPSQAFKIGPYVMLSAMGYEPHPTGYYVYYAQTNEIHTLESALLSGSDALAQQLILDSGISHGRVGDVNKDGVVNVKDATHIQKLLVNIVKENPADTQLDKDINLLVRDFDEDGKVSVKDATEIQRFVAGIVNAPYEGEIDYSVLLKLQMGKSNT